MDKVFFPPLISFCSADVKEGRSSFWLIVLAAFGSLQQLQWYKDNDNNGNYAIVVFAGAVAAAINQFS
jgi:hypothetical protein